jgi:hypothetical protein
MGRASILDGVSSRDTMATPATRIESFWELFRELAPELAVSESADTPVYDSLLERLQEIDPGLFIELDAGSGPREVTITADGDRSLFPLVREIVAAAPAIEGWTFRALKAAVGCPEVGRWENVTVRGEDVYFDAYENELGEVDLDIFIPGVGEDDAEGAHNLVLRMMDLTVGEEALAEGIHGTQLRMVEPGESMEERFTLADLPEFLEARARERKTGA